MIHLKRPDWPTAQILTGAAACMLIAAGVTLLAGSGREASAPPPAPDCVQAVSANGDADWYCGRTIRVPACARVIASNIPPCLSDDGSGPLPCRWDARTQGAIGRDGRRHGRSFTVLPDGTPRNGAQRVLFRYDNGLTVPETVPAS